MLCHLTPVILPPIMMNDEDIPLKRSGYLSTVSTLTRSACTVWLLTCADTSETDAAPIAQSVRRSASRQRFAGTRFGTYSFLSMLNRYLTSERLQGRSRRGRRGRFDTAMLIQVIFSTCTALIPGALGTLFYYSLVLDAQDSIYFLGNSTYVRPLYSKDNNILGIPIKAVEPLFLSSLSSSIVYVSSLLAGSVWIADYGAIATTYLASSQFCWHTILRISGL
jgi:hypothetical protein